MDCSRMACGAVLQSVERRRSYGTLNGTPTTARSASRMSRSLQRGTSNIEERPIGTGLRNGLSTRVSFVDLFAFDLPGRHTVVDRDLVAFLAPWRIGPPSCRDSSWRFGL